MVVSRALVREELAAGGSSPSWKMNSSAHSGGVPISPLSSAATESTLDFERQVSPFLDEKHRIGSFQAGVALFKAICGPGILFLPAAVKNAGLLSAVISSFIIGVTCMWCMLLVLDSARLLRSQGKVISQLPEIGEAAFGALGRRAVNSAIVSSQLGFCTAYCIFVAETVQALIFEGYGGMVVWESAAREPCGLPDIFADKFLVYFIILVFIPLLIPFTWIRQLRHLAWTNYIASGLVLSSLVYMLISFAVRLHAGESARESPRLFAPSGTLVYFGTAVYAFEGVSLLLPTELCMRQPSRCKAVVCWTMGFAIVVQVTFATASYLVYGEETKSIVTTSLSDGSALGGMFAVELVQLAWVVEVLLTFPLQFFPAARLIEPACFRQGAYRRRHSGQKWKKNFIRTGLLVLCMAVALGGYSSVDNLVALLGAISCVPLAIVYPAFFHYRIAFADRPEGKELNLTPSSEPSEEAEEQKATSGYLASGKEPLLSPSRLNGEGILCDGAAKAPMGGPASDLFICLLGASLVLLTTALALRAWMTTGFEFQACSLRS